MILMPELCYYCREELNFGDMTLHDGHRVHKKCLPPTNDTNKWDEAARKAAESIEYSKKNAPDEWFLIPITEMTEIIAKSHADLRATYSKLVELSAWCVSPVDYDNPEAMNEDYAKFERLKSDPLVQAAIERSKE